MASGTSDIASVQVSEESSNRRGRTVTSDVTKYYETEVTTLADGGIIRETYKVDANGNNPESIQKVTTDKDGNITANEISPDATAGEKKALNDPNSQLSQSISQQTDQAADKALESNIDPVTDKAIETAGGGSGNTATQEEEGDSQSADTTSSSVRDFGDDMIYPLNMPEGQDVITFTALTYSTKDLEGFTFGGRERVSPGGGNGRSKGTVTLPIQSGIKDRNAAGWGEDTMTPVDIAKAAVALNTITGGMEGFGDSINQLKEQVQGSTADFKTLAASAFAEKAANVKGLLARTQGVIQNPNLELLFQKPTLRPFSFTFKLSARSKSEAEMIVKIIRFFKQNMAPQKGGGSGGESANLFLKAPNTFQIHYLHQGGEHPYIGRAKECAMTSLEVDYTPDGNYSTYKDGFMTSYTMSMSFKELEPIFYEDYDDGDIPADAIGY